MSEALLARQPIYDKQLKVAAYELLFRGVDTESAQVQDGDQATSQVLVNAFGEYQLSDIIHDLPAYINYTRNLLIAHAPPPYRADKVVLEVLETVNLDEPVISACQEMVSRGYHIALDDFEFKPEWQPLLEICSVVKLDVLDKSRAELDAEVKAVKAYPHIKLIAEKIEDYDCLEMCKDLGFDYFQGYFLSRPHLIEGRRSTSTSSHVIVRLLSELQNPKTTPASLEELLKQDSRLSYKILKIINSAQYSLSREVTSLKDAIIFLGLGRLRSWATIIAMASMSKKPDALMVTTLTRAKMCEHLSIALKRDNPETYFTAGLFSTLDALLDTPMTHALSEIPLCQELKDAILNYQGPIGQILELAISYEHAAWHKLDVFTDLSDTEIRIAYLDAIRWSEEISQVTN